MNDQKEIQSQPPLLSKYDIRMIFAFVLGGSGAIFGLMYLGYTLHETYLPALLAALVIGMLARLKEIDY